MKLPSKEKQGAILLLSILLWSAALFFLWLGFKGVSATGLWTRAGMSAYQTMPAEGFLFFGFVLLVFSWIIRKA